MYIYIYIYIHPSIFLDLQMIVKKMDLRCCQKKIFLETKLAIVRHNRQCVKYVGLFLVKYVGLKNLSYIYHSSEKEFF